MGLNRHACKLQRYLLVEEYNHNVVTEVNIIFSHLFSHLNIFLSNLMESVNLRGC